MGLGVGDFVGAGVGDGLGVGEGDGDGVGVGVGESVGVAIGRTVAREICGEACELSVTGLCTFITIETKATANKTNTTTAMMAEPLFFLTLHY